MQISYSSMFHLKEQVVIYNTFTLSNFNNCFICYVERLLVYDSGAIIMGIEIYNVILVTI